MLFSFKTVFVSWIGAGDVILKIGVFDNGCPMLDGVRFVDDEGSSGVEFIWFEGSNRLKMQNDRNLVDCTNPMDKTNTYLEMLDIIVMELMALLEDQLIEAVEVCI